jgi:predicted HTH transcriptional regulator
LLGNRNKHAGFCPKESNKNLIMAASATYDRERKQPGGLRILMKIDALDRMILHLMSKDGRISSVEIARRTGENERKVVYRVNALLQSDVISMTSP